jgi:hypothetical protein
MAKKAIYFGEAERLFVQEQLNPMQIAGKLKLGEKTVREWKSEGKWDEKRREYLQARKAFHEELYELSRALTKSVVDDINSGNEPGQGRVYLLKNLIGSLGKVKDYEDVRKEQESEGKSDQVPEEVLKRIQREVLGIEEE